MIAAGTFDVDLQPLEPFTKGGAGVRIDRLSITKTFAGDLSARSLGEMISARTSAPDSAGYVAIEQVQGTLHGQSGSFVLQHYGILNQGQQHLTLEVVPGSGTGQLEHITGRMTIRIENGNHFYEFDYSLL